MIARAPSIAALVSVLAAPAALGRGASTLDETLDGGDKAQAFQFLTLGPGERYVVRPAIGEPLAGRSESCGCA